MELIWFVLASYGLTQILVYGKIFNNYRPNKEDFMGWGELFHCPMCMGFHVGWFLVLLSPLTELFSFDVSLFNFVIMGSLSSGTSYILNMVFSDDGIQISQNMRIGNEDHEE